jgi:hypothetical protein
MERTGKITGTIDANQNPVFFGQGNVVIWWETNDPTGGEVRVSTSAGDEKLVSKSSGQSGRTEIPWIVGSTVYDFRLCAASKAEAPVDSMQVRRAIGSAPIALRELSDEIGRGNVDMSDLSQFIAAAMPACLHNPCFRELFRTWERHGFHVTPVHFYQPIPDTQNLPETVWNRRSNLVGIDMNDPLHSIYCGRIFQNSETNINSFWLQAATWATVRLLFLSLGDLTSGYVQESFHQHRYSSVRRCRKQSSKMPGDSISICTRLQDIPQTRASV